MVSVYQLYMYILSGENNSPVCAEDIKTNDTMEKKARWQDYRLEWRANPSYNSCAQPKTNYQNNKIQYDFKMK